jgi:hypothetical protein
MTILGKMTLRITPLGIMILSIATLGKMTLSITTLGITTLGIMTLSKMKLSITTRRIQQHNDTQDIERSAY